MSAQAICISYTKYSNNRMECVKEAFESLGYEVTVFSSDFDHYTKAYYKTDDEHTVLFHVPAYKKNLSFQRILSYLIFSRKVYLALKDRKPDVIYDLIPPNSAVKACAKYKKKNAVKLIFDVFDLWPETFPYRQNFILKIPFGIWKNIRDNSIGCADAVWYECGLFENKLSAVTAACRNSVVYLSSASVENDLSQVVLNEGTLDIGYLGSINNIIDIDTIKALMCELNKINKVTLHIVGDGEKREEFVETLCKSGINVEFYGKVYDENQKKNIFNKCAFGLNIMRENVCIGLSMKTADYMKLGVPIINNIPSDTYDMVNKYNAGINIDVASLSETAAEIAKVTADGNKAMRKNARKVYEDFFSSEMFKQKIVQSIQEITSK